MKFIITVDTEADNPWARPKNITVENLRYLSRFQELCDSYDFKPTYLATYEVAKSRVFFDIVDRLQKEGKAEVGAHLHPWSCPPFEDITPDDLRYQPYPHELPISLFKAKMESLTTALEQAFNTGPKTYRGGRWGFDPGHIGVLIDLGYIADCTVTPHISWERHLGNPNGKGGPDYKRAPIYPYFMDPHDICKPGISNLLEVPLTVLLNEMQWAKSIYLSMGKTIVGGLALAKFGIGPRSFRPSSTRNARQLIHLYKTARKLRLPYIQMMVHSSEFMPGGSPYNPDENSIEHLYSRLKELFKYLKSEQVQGETLFNFADSYISTLRTGEP